MNGVQGDRKVGRGLRPGTPPGPQAEPRSVSGLYGKGQASCQLVFPKGRRPWDMGVPASGGFPGRAAVPRLGEERDCRGGPQGRVVQTQSAQVPTEAVGMRGKPDVTHPATCPVLLQGGLRRQPQGHRQCPASGQAWSRQGKGKQLFLINQGKVSVSDSKGEGQGIHRGGGERGTVKGPGTPNLRNICDFTQACGGSWEERDWGAHPPWGAR